MAEFLTTKAIASELDNIIKKSSRVLYILTPYLKLSDSFYERLSEATESNIVTNIVYGKEELTKREEKLIYDLNCNIYYKDNLHGKCYINEDFALITSMNLHSFSEANNREFGVLLSRRKNSAAYKDCLIEIDSVIKKPFPKE